MVGVDTIAPENSAEPRAVRHVRLGDRQYRRQAVGVPDVIFALVIGILSGGVVAILLLLVQGLVQKKYTAFTAIPYGPFLILGGAVMLYYGKEFMTWYSTR